MIGDSDAVNEPEDDYDAHNDETFGDDGSVYTWEDAQIPIDALEKKNTSNGDKYRTHKEPQTPHNEFRDFENAYGDRLKETDYDDFENENALEESISRLVLDEYDEDEEEAKKIKLRRLGGITNYNTYFMPPQVANKHLQWLVDKELPGGSSLLGSSVWSMHPTSVPSAPQPSIPVNDVSPVVPTAPGMTTLCINNLHPVIKNDIKDTPTSHSASSNLGILLGVRPEVEETNASMLSPEVTDKPKFRTVDELEKELLKEVAGDVTPVRTNSESTGSGARPKVMSVEELEREWMETSTPIKNEPTHQNTPRQGQQIPHHTPAILPLHAQQAVHPSVTGISNNRPALGMTPGGLNVGQMAMMRPNMPQMPHGRQIRNPPPGAFAQNIIPNVGMPSVPPNIHFANMNMQQQHNMRFWQMNPQFRNRLPYNVPFNAMAVRQGVVVPPGYGLGPQNQNFRRAHVSNTMKTEDPFRGLMNEKDKQRLRNIQIIQLQNDHPYPTDYYSLMNIIRNSPVSNPERHRELLSKLFPKKSDDTANKHHYQPAHFENSLGKLQAVSALAPKKAIDTVIRVVDSGPSSRAGPKAYRYLLLEIEKLYECLLNIEEADIRLRLLCNGDESSIQLRQENGSKIINVLKSPEKVSEYLAVRKGKMLISRLIPLMDASIRYPVFNHMLRTFPTWANINNTELEKAYPYLRHCILSAEFRDLLVSMDAMDHKVYLYMTKTKLGLSLLVAFLHQAECLLVKAEPSINKSTLWYLNARAIAVALLREENEIVAPTEVFCNMIPHFQRCEVPQPDLLRLVTLWKKWAASGVPVI